MSWTMATVGDAFDFVRNGKSVKQSKDIDGLPVTRIETIANRTVDPARVGYAGLSEAGNEQWLLRKGDILFSHINSVDHIGKCAIYEGTPEKLIHGMNLLALRPGKSLYPKFAFYALSHETFRAQLLPFVNKAVNQASVSTTNLKTLEIPLPPLDEQKRIAAILDKADQLRQKRRQAIALLDSLTQSIFLEMFGDQQRKVSLGEICTRITDGTHQAPNWSDSGIPFLFVSNIRNQTISFETNKFVSHQEYKRLTKNCPIEAGDVLYTAVGSYGNAAVVPYNKTFVFQRHIAQLKPLLDRVSSIFLAYALESSTVRQQADRLARGVAQKTVTLTSLREFEIPLPSIESQKMFEHKVSNIGSVKTRWDAERLDSLFASLQHRAFSGQL